MKKLLSLLMFVPILASAKVTLPSIFGSGMVLQQNTQVKIWGTADSQDTVKVVPSWTNTTFHALPDANGNWSLRIPTYAADFKNYTLEVAHKGSKQTFHDVLFGEVWVCSGQSNMEMKMKGWYWNAIRGGQEAIANSRNEYIRLFDVEKKFSDKELTDCKGEWKFANPKTVAMTSATAYFFGRQLFQTLNVPVALVTSHWGGAGIVAFMSEKSLKPYSQYKMPRVTKKEMDVFTPTAIYNAMIKPIEGYTMKGVIWYQGETDRKIPELYRKLSKSMLDDWRANWDCGEFPFIYAQVAPFHYPNENGNSAYIREAQNFCQKENKNMYMVSLTDVGEENNIHPSRKQEVGFRMACKAFDKVYGIDGIYSDEPEFVSMKIDGNKARLKFNHATWGFTTYGKPVTAFKIAGEDKVFYPAKANLNVGNIVVYSEKVPHPVAVRYAFTDYADGTVYNVEGCCLTTFRTDNWEEKDCKYAE